MNDTITIVTGFFDCNRGEHKEQARSNDKYFEYFKFWARIQNKVVIFGTKETIEKALEIRKQFGRGNETIIVQIDDPTSIETDIYNRMKKIEEKGLIGNLRSRKFDVSNEALYDYIMFLKFWMMKYTAENVTDCGTLAWIDFGFNHGGDCYQNPDEFDFNWKYPFNTEKIHLFTRGKMNEENGVLKLLLMTDLIMGSPFMYCSEHAENIYNIIKNELQSLLDLDIFDDDQMCMKMALNRFPDLFEVHESDWFMPIKEYGGEHLSIKDKDSAKKNLGSFLRGKSVVDIVIYVKARFIYGLTVERYLYWKRLGKIFKDYLK